MTAFAIEMIAVGVDDAERVTSAVIRTPPAPSGPSNDTATAYLFASNATMR